MNASGTLPRALRIVAWLFLFGGINSLLTIIVCAMNGQLQLDFGVVGIFVFFGLKHLSPGWRICGLVILALNMVLMPIIAVLGLIAPEGHFDLFGQHIASIPPPLVSLVCLGWFALSIWEWRVLTRPEVAVLFRKPLVHPRLIKPIR